MINELWSDRLHILLKEEEILSRIRIIAKNIENKYSPYLDKIVILGIMDGCLPFLYNLIKDINLKLEIKTVKINTYFGQNKVNKCKINMDHDEYFCLHNARVIIVDDILDTGETLRGAIDATTKFAPSSIETIVLLDKRKTDFCANYTGFKIKDKFIIGFGLDYKGFYRNLKDIYYME